MTAKGHRFSIQQGKRQSPTSFYHYSAPELHPFHGETKPNWRNILFLNTPYSKSGLNVKVLKVLRFQVFLWAKNLGKTQSFIAISTSPFMIQKNKTEKEKGFLSLLPSDWPLLLAQSVPSNSSVLPQCFPKCAWKRELQKGVVDR